MKLIEATLKERTLMQFREAFPELFMGMEMVAVNKIETCPAIHVICRAPDNFEPFREGYGFSEVTRVYTRPGYIPVQFFARHKNIKVVQATRDAVECKNFGTLCDQLAATLEMEGWASKYFATLPGHSGLWILNGGSRVKRLTWPDESMARFECRLVRRENAFLLALPTGSNRVYSVALNDVRNLMSYTTDFGGWNEALKLPGRNMSCLMTRNDRDVFITMSDRRGSRIQHFPVRQRSETYLGLTKGKSFVDKDAVLGGPLFRVEGANPYVLKDHHISTTSVAEPNGIPRGFQEFISRPEM